MPYNECMTSVNNIDYKSDSCIVFRLGSYSWKKVLSNSHVKSEVEDTMMNQCSALEMSSVELALKYLSDIQHCRPKFDLESWIIDESLTYMCKSFSLILLYLNQLRVGTRRSILNSYVLLTSTEESASALVSLTYAELYNHLKSLSLERLERLLRPVLVKFMQHPRNSNGTSSTGVGNGVFNSPVDVEGLELFDYFEKIKYPMDLGTIKSGLLAGNYSNIEDFCRDVELVFTNAMVYNATAHPIHHNAKLLLGEVRSEVKLSLEKFVREEDKRLNHICASCCQSTVDDGKFFSDNPDCVTEDPLPPCLLCGDKCLKLEPPVLVCYGTCCQKIKKNSVYYITEDGLYMWCFKCYSGLPSTVVEPSTVQQKAVYKTDLLKRTLDAEVNESWVNCDTCGGWMHQICCLINDRVYCVNVEEGHGIEVPSPMKEDSESRRTRSVSMASRVSSVSSGRVCSTKSYFECPMCKIEKRSVVDVSKLKDKVEKFMKKGSKKQSIFSMENVNLSMLSVGERNEICHVIDDSLPSPDGRQAVRVRKNKFAGSDYISDTLCTGEDRALLGTPAKVVKTTKLDGENIYKKQYDQKRKRHEDSSLSPVAVTRCVSIGTFMSDSLFSLNMNERSRVESAVSVVSDDSCERMESKEEDVLPSSPAKLGDDVKESPISVLHDSFSDVSDNESCASLTGDVAHLPRSSQWTASTLPTCHLSDFMEEVVRHRILACGFSSECANSITIRVVSNVDQQLEVPSCIQENFAADIAGHQIPSYLPFRQKCVLLFQNVDGVDLCLFCLYVQEFDENCPAPNTSRVYIAYLDSVEYFRPMRARTLVYHELMVSYLKWAQMRGFKHANIWSCPPQRGDNFIFWCHPQHQRTPSRDLLNSWYSVIVERCKEVGIVSEISNLYASHFQHFEKKRRSDGLVRAASKNNVFLQEPLASDSMPNKLVTLSGVPVSAPVFEGDYWINEVIRISRVVQGRQKVVEMGVKFVGSPAAPRQAGLTHDKLGNQRKCREILKYLFVGGSGVTSSATPFLHPVDPVALNIPDYLTIITEPMDLSTCREKLRSGKDYPTVLEFAKDLRLIFANAIRYNYSPQHYIHITAQRFAADVENALWEFVKDKFGGDALYSNFFDANMPQVCGGSELNLAPDQLLSLIPLGDIHITLLGDDATDTSNSGVAKLPPNTSDYCQASPSLGSISDLDSTEGRSLVRRLSSGSVVSSHSSVYSSCGSDNGFECASDLNEMPHSGDDDSRVSYDRGAQRFMPNGLLSHSSRKLINPVMSNSFIEECRLGMKGMESLLGELCRNMIRFKEDLFVITFANRNENADELPVDDADESESEVSEDDVELGVVESVVKARGRPKTVSPGLADAPPKTTGQGKRKRRKKAKQSSISTPRPISSFRRHKLFKTKGNTAFLSSKAESILSSCFPGLNINEIYPDPDSLLQSPFVDARHTFLEMCQYRHYQFDTLRRAKHSSLMLLYHLHNPFGNHLRPKCSVCSEIIQDVRWHCDVCSKGGRGSSCTSACEYELCDRCYKTKGALHDHEMTPYRVTFI